MSTILSLSASSTLRLPEITAIEVNELEICIDVLVGDIEFFKFLAVFESFDSRNHVL